MRELKYLTVFFLFSLFTLSAIRLILNRCNGHLGDFSDLERDAVIGCSFDTISGV